MPSVEVRNLTKTYNGVKVVDGVSFAVRDGSCASLLGPSGCGKTTTLRMLAGFERPDGGSILIGGVPVADTNGRFVPADKRNIGFVFQSYALWPHMRVFDQVAYPLRVRRLAKGSQVKARVVRALEQVELASMMDKYPSQLSGGQQQRVALARALVFEPSVVLLDEPLSNLDAGLRSQMRSELAALQHRLKATFVYVTHDKSEALALSNQVLVMRAGKIVEDGAPAAIYTAPKSAYTARFVAGANCIPARVVSSAEESSVVDLGSSRHLRGVDRESGRRRPGDAVVAVIRPEHIRIVGQEENGRAGDNVFAATVLSRTYLGSHDELRVKVEGLELLQVHTEPGGDHQVGQPVRVQLPERLVRVVTPEAAA